MFKPSALLAALVASLALPSTLLAQTAPASGSAPATASRPAGRGASPAEIPGKGLAEHDFFYAGESSTTQKMFIIRKGAVEWTYTHNGKGEISDATLLSNGSVIFAHQYGMALVSADKKVLWKMDAPTGTEIHTVIPIGTDRILYIQNGKPAELKILNIKTGETEKHFELPVGNANSVHGQFRHARLTAAGTLVVAHMDSRKVVEYDEDGKSLWSIDVAASPWSAVRLDNGNTLISGSKFVREVNPAKETVWEFLPTNLPEYTVSGFQIATRLPSGNTMINNWVNPPASTDPATGPAQAWEVTPEKKVVWTLRSWAPVNLGPSTIIQILDKPSVAENVHFGSIK